MGLDFWPDELTAGLAGLCQPVEKYPVSDNEEVSCTRLLQFHIQ